ncbi:hypothetical protein [Hyphomicrobium sp.]|jgi:hypothetical protein|nr:hypothetical protein [Hyphomicrobium sp.]
MCDEYWGERFAEKARPHLREMFDQNWDELPSRLVLLLEALGKN